MKGSYYHTKKSVDEYIKLAKDVNGRVLIEKFKKFLPPGSNILELGSGPGTDWMILKKYFHVTGSDNSTEFLRRLRSRNPEAEFIELDAVTILTEKKFNGIYSNKVLHHLNDNELSPSIKRQAEILLPGGIICHSFWRGEGNETYNGLFVNYHSDMNITKVFEKYFKVLLLENYKEFEEEDSILFIGRKK